MRSISNTGGDEQTRDGVKQDRRCFSSWLKPICRESSCSSLYSNVQEIKSIIDNASDHAWDDSKECDQIDEWEKSFSLNWLTRLLSFTLKRCSENDDQNDWESLSSLIAQVMAQMTENPNTNPSDHLLRVHSFQLSLEEATSKLEFSDILIQRLSSINLQIATQLREASASYSAIGFQTWNSAAVMCRRLCETPFELFPQLLSRHQSSNTSGRLSLKVLELGSGTGLLGLTAAQIIARILVLLSGIVSFDVQVILTDYHPEVLDNLQHNLELNRNVLSLPKSCTSSLTVKVMKLDWREFRSSELTNAGLDGAFDMILGSDLVYEPEHAIWASNAVKYFLKPENVLAEQPNVNLLLDLKPSFHLLLPLRPTFTKESQAVHAAFGGSDVNLLLDQTDQSTLPTHDCKWELLKTNSGESIHEVPDARPLKIVKYAREEGVKFGQGCGEYQYLLIRWADLPHDQ